MAAIQQMISTQGGDDIALGSLYFNREELQHVNHGCYFQPEEQYTHFFYEAWVNPTASGAGWVGYHISDNQGGNHNILWGIQAGTEFYTVTGNVYGDAGLNSFASPETLPLGYWAHLAVGWDGSNIMLWVNGVMSAVAAYTSAYTVNPGGNDPELFIGGSDHNNFNGNIAQLRMYGPGNGKCRFTSDFTPELYFRPTYLAGGTTPARAEFVVHYTTPETIYVDRGAGFQGELHDGVMESVQGVGSAEATSSYVGLSLPTFQKGNITTGQYVPTPPATPAGALVFDSFSRRDQNSVAPTSLITGYYTLGQTEAGSLGPLTWTLPNGSAATSGAGILNGKAFIVNNASGNVVETSTQNVDVRVDRGVVSASGRTGLLVRYKDANDFYFVLGQDELISVYKHEGGVITGVTQAVTGGWTTLRAVANGTSFKVYTGTATEGAFTEQISFTCTNVAGATKAGIERQTGFPLVFRYDNFLVKSA